MSFVKSSAILFSALALFLLIGVSFSAPAIEISYPYDGFEGESRDVDVSFSVSSDAVYCNYSVNGEEIVALDSCSGFLLSNVPYGFNSLTIYAIDADGGVGEATTTFSILRHPIDPIPPIVNVGYEKYANEEFEENATVLSSTSEIVSYLWVVASGPGQVTFSAQDSPNTLIFADTDGVYVITLFATDTYDLTGNGSFNLIWDTMPPEISILEFPLVDAQKNANADLSGACSENNIDVYISIISGNGESGEITGTPLCRNGEWKIKLDISALPDGNLTATATQSDLAGNSASSTAESSKDTVVPEIILLSPEDGFVTNLNGIEFTWQSTHSSNCTIQISNQSGEISAEILPSDSGYSYFADSLSEGEHTWSVSCIAKKNSAKSEKRSFFVDTIAPAVELQSPANKSSTSSKKPQFKFTPEDNLGLDLNCTLAIDGENAVSGIIAKPGTLQTVSIPSSLSDSTHTWNVSCIDSAANLGSSGIWRFSVSIKKPSGGSGSRGATPLSVVAPNDSQGQPAANESQASPETQEQNQSQPQSEPTQQESAEQSQSQSGSQSSSQASSTANSQPQANLLPLEADDSQSSLASASLFGLTAQGLLIAAPLAILAMVGIYLYLIRKKK
jgi:hypothetical protein